MPKRNKILMITIVIITFLLRIIIQLAYKSANTFSLVKELYEINKIYLVREWTPHSQEDYQDIIIDSQMEHEILNLITNHKYYKQRIYGYSGDISIIEIHIESSNQAGDKVYYDYYISNAGQIEIRNRSKGTGYFYSLKNNILFSHDSEGQQGEKMYLELVQLITRE